MLPENLPEGELAPFDAENLDATVAERAALSRARKRPFVIGVAGGTGSGKTTVSRHLQATVGAARIAYVQHDSYYNDHSHLPPDERARCNYDHPNSLDTRLLVRHLHALCQWQAIDVPIYDFATHARTVHTQRVEPAPIILVEGILLFSERELREMMDIRIYVDTDADIRFIRRLHRDVEERGRTLDSIISQYLNTVRPMHLEFVEPSKRYADVIVPEGGNNRVAMEMIVSRILAVLAQP
jgi:uridine kinase